MRPEEVLDYWFGTARPLQPRIAAWFQESSKHDEEIRARFGQTLQDARDGKLDGWAKTPRGRLALIVVLDQFSRQLHRGTGRMFENDAKALELAHAALSAGEDRGLEPLEVPFLLLPLEHSEQLADQEEAVRRFEALRTRAPDDLRKAMDSFVDYARRHLEVIARFGRFPHRNAPLGRSSTQEEREFLLQPGSSF